jgi:hypothetical protein
MKGMWKRFLFVKTIGVFQSGGTWKDRCGAMAYVLFGKNAPEIRRANSNTFSTDAKLDYRALFETAELRRDTARIVKLATEETGLFAIHTPAAGCPEGWTCVENLFSMYDGRLQFDGCILMKGGIGNSYGVRVDYLRPSETVRLPIFVPEIVEPPSENGN